jgi:hypothetical protein
MYEIQGTWYDLKNALKRLRFYKLQRMSVDIQEEAIASAVGVKKSTGFAQRSETAALFGTRAMA